MIIKNPHHCTRIEIWAPKYSGAEGEYGEWVVLLSKNKVHHASPVILIEFTKAPHLKAQRFAIHRNTVERCPLGNNGKIQCYLVRFSQLESWESEAEVAQIASNLFN